METVSIGVLNSTLSRIETLLKSRHIRAELVATTGTVTIKGGFSKLSVITDGNATTITVGAGSAVTISSSTSYTFGGDKNDIVITDIVIAANGDNIQYMVEYGGDY